ncbi:hypothetical protein [Streptomyces sp. NPDC094437]|uniref:hypothetical protein n=1 Tax=Streptomyces sp. NPDC094437 TaxID=3366060 RepID=UPI0037F2DF36
MADGSGGGDAPRVRPRPGIQGEDAATASLHFANGACLGTLPATTTAAHPRRTPRPAVHGDGSALGIVDERAGLAHLPEEGEQAASYGAFGAGDQSADHAAALVRDTARNRGGLLHQPHHDQLADFCGAVGQGRAPLAAG